MSEFAGKVLVVTGGGAGIGRAAALLLAGDGARVAVIDINATTARETASMIEAQGGTGLALGVDISDSKGVAAAIAQTAEAFGRIDILFANAAEQISKACAETTEEEWERIHDVNLKGTFLCCKQVIPIMQRQRSGCIVITSSGHAFYTYPNCSAYAATKAGLLGFTRALALDYAADGIRVNCLVPGSTETPMLRNYINSCPDPAAEEQRILAKIPMGRFAQPEDIAKAVRFFASDDAAYVTGTWLAVDGGLLAHG
jgi:NAD(P)-dependent dehydrogenase (short-subunit alcohol dehydrogenase family)